MHVKKKLCNICNGTSDFRDFVIIAKIVEGGIEGPQSF